MECQLLKFRERETGAIKRFKAKITYAIDKDYLDYIHLPIDKRDGTLEYSDIYTIDEDGLLELGYDNPENYIMENLLLIIVGSCLFIFIAILLNMSLGNSKYRI